MNIFDDEKKLEESMMGLTKTIEKAVDDYYNSQDYANLKKEFGLDEHSNQSKHTLEELMQAALEYLYQKFVSGKHISGEDCSIFVNLISFHTVNKKN